ncbi:MAG: HK97 family phage prohead protease [Rhizobiales bacterium]|nr:HK97 family phage prohead protease [Hyphomicrobiales bacterium]MBN8983434.1 HK97 family phage prohead protease [Hyphomicrobiales bacterium]
MKTKDFAFKVKAAEDSGEIEGYVSVFGVRDSYNEAVMPGAFSDSLAKHKREGTYPLMLWQHNPDEPIGVWHEMSDDGKGLHAKGQLLKGVRRADEALIMLKAGAIQGMSIGYREVDVEPSDGANPRKLVKLNLLEASIVSFPANIRARVDAVKADGMMSEFARRLRDGDAPSIKEFEDVLREAGVPKAMAVQIASVGYAKAVRSESEGGEAIKSAVSEAIASLRSINQK